MIIACDGWMGPMDKEDHDRIFRNPSDVAKTLFKSIENSKSSFKEISEAFECASCKELKAYIEELEGIDYVKRKKIVKEIANMSGISLIDINRVYDAYAEQPEGK